MFILWIAGIILALFFLEYTFLLFKRIRLLKKIKKKADHVYYCRNVFHSVFFPDGKPDLIVEKSNKQFTISVLTTPFQKVRYHFDNNKKIEILWEKGWVLILNPRVPRGNFYLDSPFKIKKYKITFEALPETSQFVIPHPAPVALSRVKGAKIDILGNGDFLFEDIKICGLKYFLDFVLSP